MNDVCATVGIENLKHFEKIIKRHKDNAKFYDENLKNVPGVTLLKRQKDYESAFWIYSILVDDRDGFYKYMHERGISVSQVHERNDKHTCVREFACNLPSIEKIIDKIVSIPVGWWVTDEDREYIVETIKKRF
jgi:dTDP-4-amino-4,6-dideoxygalactose transaminase